MSEISAPAALASLVEYQDGSIVSKTVLKSDSGNVTLFAFAAGQGLSEHTAPFDAIVTVLDGEAEVILSGQAQTVAVGEMIILPAGIPHAVKAHRPFKMLLVMLKQASRDATSLSRGGTQK
jgi:quercetin dioxygenase-like cupin family protein